MKKSKLLIVIVLCIFCATISLMLLVRYEISKPVGLFVVRSDVGYFECAKAVHGNYLFYYDPGQRMFLFDRGGERCYVDTWQFRERYIKMFGRTNEIFIGGK